VLTVLTSIYLSSAVKPLSDGFDASPCTLTALELDVDLTSPIIHQEGTVFLILCCERQPASAHMIGLRDIDLSDPAELPAFFVNVVLQVEEVLSGLHLLQYYQVS
jgi:hypothetical protein